VLLIETGVCAAVLQSMSSDQRKELTPIKLRKKAAQFAVKTVDAQREQFKVGRPL
jgi:isoleucyl-tRNA synthetase